MTPAVSQVCTLHAPFETDIVDFAAGGCVAIELWLGKLEGYLEDHSADEVRRLLVENEVSAPAASYQGGLLISQGPSRREHWDHFKQRLSLCRELGVPTLVIAADIVGPLDQQLLDRVQVSLREAAEQAAEHDVRLALEFQAPSTFCNNLQTAVALVEDVGSASLGICLDAFHLFTGPSKTEDLGYLTAANLFHVQLCDLSGPPRELATDADRILPGDGELPLSSIVERLNAIEYRGAVAVEVMNPNLWTVAPRQLGEIANTALLRTLGCSPAC